MTYTVSSGTLNLIQLQLACAALLWPAIYMFIPLHVTSNNRSSVSRELARDARNSHWRPLKVIRCCVNRRGIYDFLLARNSNLTSIFNRLWDITPSLCALSTERTPKCFWYTVYKTWLIVNDSFWRTHRALKKLFPRSRIWVDRTSCTKFGKHEAIIGALRCCSGVWINCCNSKNRRHTQKMHDVGRNFLNFFKTRTFWPL